MLKLSYKAASLFLHTKARPAYIAQLFTNGNTCSTSCSGIVVLHGKTHIRATHQKLIYASWHITPTPSFSYIGISLRIKYWLTSTRYKSRSWSISRLGETLLTLNWGKTWEARYAYTIIILQTTIFLQHNPHL